MGMTKRNTKVWRNAENSNGFMNINVDMICDILKCGHSVDGIKVSSPEELRDYYADSIVVIAIEEPKGWSEVKEELIAFGYAERHIFTIFEHLAANGRRWQDIIDSIKL
jgi:hypothetical protein